MANTIQAKRLERGMKQKDFADALAVDRVTIWRWENDVTTIPEKMVKRIARFFQVTPAEILPDWSLIPSPDDQEPTIAESHQHA